MIASRQKATSRRHRPLGVNEVVAWQLVEAMKTRKTSKPSDVHPRMVRAPRRRRTRTSPVWPAIRPAGIRNRVNQSKRFGLYVANELRDDPALIQRSTRNVFVGPTRPAVISRATARSPVSTVGSWVPLTLACTVLPTAPATPLSVPRPLLPATLSSRDFLIRIEIRVDTGQFGVDTSEVSVQQSL